ncbi:MAG: FAD-binding protein [Gammaproteobacteria bacterium]|nr:FAD-binding protein [Gammaproteobacteria bacterium]NIR84349.1 FAD-binding protein [Gammaproteobacteria bacterium]NIR89865.1 FAD-binding protein [Gammaproteobacteria bacterium]NIU05732.1 FAD-binding protein [Gammaproteobacteria bacterium]NIV52492.1 FAD-binding protein [Gammaproteobacteria bacterium]
MRPSDNDIIQIAGAGPAGLAAAISLARCGRRVVVDEAQPEVGHRFIRDLQGLENWSTRTDVLDELRGAGIISDFPRVPYRGATVFDAWGRAYEFHSETPLFYLVERGPGPDSLDAALLAQALELGVEVRFNSRVEHLEGPGILAIGPRAGDAIAVGYLFETAMADGVWVICDDTLAPQGYAYLIVKAGWGTVKSAMFSNFKQERIYVERTVAAFRRLVGLDMTDARAHGGAGNFRIPRSARSGTHPVVGEQAGFQDTLWGFGIRLAITSGVLAARSLVEGSDYDAAWRRAFAPQLRVSVVNRALYGRLGNPGYRLFLRHAARQRDVRSFLRRHYQPSLAKTLMLPWARAQWHSRRRDEACNHVACECVWCRHGQAAHADLSCATPGQV